MTNENEEKMEPIVEPKQAKLAVYYFCNCVKYEMDRLHTDNARKALDTIMTNLYHISKKHAKNLSIKPISDNFELLESFVNKRNHIPYYIWQWLYAYYADYVDLEESCNTKPLETYYKIKQYFIKHHRWYKQDDKDNEFYAKIQRRKLSRLARDGEYNYTLSAHNKSFSELFTHEEFDKAKVIFSNLFFEQLKEYHDDVQTVTAAFLLGVRQGIRTERTRANSETFTNLNTRLLPECSGDDKYKTDRKEVNING